MTKSTCKFSLALICLLWSGLVSAASGADPKSGSGSAVEPEFSLGVIPALSVVSDGHVSATKNGVKFEVYFANGPKRNAVIYAINTGRKQLVLTPEKH